MLDAHIIERLKQARKRRSPERQGIPLHIEQRPHPEERDEESSEPSGNEDRGSIDFRV
jgi:hypothetical protein